MLEQKGTHTLVDELKNIKGDVLSDDYSLGMYSTDASFYQVKPLVVVLPRDEADVRIAVDVAHRLQLKILPRGAGTSLAGQTVGEAIVIDFSKYMNKILSFENDVVTVEPGVVRSQLNLFL